MTPFEYLLLFLVVILGLAMCELAIGLNRLLSDQRPVRWGLLVPLTGVLTFLKLVTQWWAWHGAITVASGITFEIYLALLISTVFLFMIAAAVFPPAGCDEPIDLGEHYERIRPRFWILFSLHFVIATTIILWLDVRVAHLQISFADPGFLVLPIAVSLIFVRNPAWNGLVLAGLSLIYLAQNLGHSFQ